MIGCIEPGNLTQAKERCRDCFALIEKPGIITKCGAWWCDLVNRAIETVEICTLWPQEGQSNDQENRTQK